eukprot:COSAG06_NODE_26_length_32102_cov_250.952911_31_plen_142_part_00
MHCPCSASAQETAATVAASTLAGDAGECTHVCVADIVARGGRRHHGRGGGQEQRCSGHRHLYRDMYLGRHRAAPTAGITCVRADPTSERRGPSHYANALSDTPHECLTIDDLPGFISHCCESGITADFELPSYIYGAAATM